MDRLYHLLWTWNQEDKHKSQLEIISAVLLILLIVRFVTEYMHEKNKKKKRDQIIQLKKIVSHGVTSMKMVPLGAAFSQFESMNKPV